MASFVQSHVQDQNKASSATNLRVRVGPAGVAAFNLLAAWVCFDNTGSATPTVNSIAVPAGETATWARLQQHNSATATAGAGVRGELWAIRTTVDWPASTDYPITLSAAVTAKACQPAEFSGVSATQRSTPGAGTSTAGTPTSVTSGTAPVTGDLVLGLGSFETSTVPTRDADTLNGSWADAFPPFAIVGGTAATNVALIGQYKLVTAGGQQTYNPTGLSDSGALVVALVAVNETMATAAPADAAATADEATAAVQTGSSATADHADAAADALGVAALAEQAFLAGLSVVGGDDRLREGSPALPADTVAGTADATATAVSSLFGPPLNLTATPVSASRVDLDWDPVMGAGSYDVERDGAVIAYSVTATSYSDTGLTAATEYSYRVRSVRS